MENIISKTNSKSTILGTGHKGIPGSQGSSPTPSQPPIPPKRKPIPPASPPSQFVKQAPPNVKKQSS